MFPLHRADTAVDYWSSPTTMYPTTKGAQFTLIANVPYDTVRQDLVVEFRKYGRVELAMVVCDEASRHPHKEWTSTAGYAFVRFSQRCEAAAAIQAASLGLITIRGTRVRADWARKDSYAKRGRVSATQGAPLLGPMGLPDGIEQLQQSLMEQQSAIPLTGRRTNDFRLHFSPRNKLRTTTDDEQEGEGSLSDVPPSNTEVIRSLQDAFNHMLCNRRPPQEELQTLATAPATPELRCRDERLGIKQQHPSAPAVEDATPATDIPSPNFGADLAAYLSSSGRERVAFDSQWLDSSPSESLPKKMDELPALIHPGSSSVSGSTECRMKFEEVLSPSSRGLLVQALSDVVGAFDSSECTPTALTQTTACSTNPHELLQRAINGCCVDEQHPSLINTMKNASSTSTGGGNRLPTFFTSVIDTDRGFGNMRFEARGSAAAASNI